MRLMPLGVCVALVLASALVSLLGAFLTSLVKADAQPVWVRSCTLSNDKPTTIIVKCGDYTHKIRKQDEVVVTAIGTRHLQVECRAYRARGVGNDLILECA